MSKVFHANLDSLSTVLAIFRHRQDIAHILQKSSGETLKFTDFMDMFGGIAEQVLIKLRRSLKIILIRKYFGANN